MKFSELTRQREIGVLAFTGLKDADLSDPQYDSRKVQNGSAFFAIKGFAADGHSFIRSAIEKGAASIVLEDPTAFTEAEAEAKKINRILVTNSRKALAIISEEAFGSPSKSCKRSSSADLSAHCGGNPSSLVSLLRNLPFPVNRRRASR